MTDTIRNALSFVPAHDREIWLSMGMAIKSQLGDAGFDYGMSGAVKTPHTTQGLQKPSGRASNPVEASAWVR